MQKTKDRLLIEACCIVIFVCTNVKDRPPLERHPQKALHVMWSLWESAWKLKKSHRKGLNGKEIGMVTSIVFRKFMLDMFLCK